MNKGILTIVIILITVMLVQIIVIAQTPPTKEDFEDEEEKTLRTKMPIYNNLINILNGKIPNLQSTDPKKSIFTNIINTINGKKTKYDKMMLAYPSQNVVAFVVINDKKMTDHFCELPTGNDPFTCLMTTNSKFQTTTVDGIYAELPVGATWNFATPNSLVLVDATTNAETPIPCKDVNRNPTATKKGMCAVYEEETAGGYKLPDGDYKVGVKLTKPAT